MSRLSHWPVLAIFSLCISVNTGAQSSASDANTICNFGPDKQLAVDYERVVFARGKKVMSSVPYGRVWTPGGKPLTLFTNTTISVGGKNIPDGAYTMFVIPEEDKPWTLIVSKSTDTSGKYDKSRDLLRIPMEFGQLPQAEPEFTAYFAHVAPNQCNLRLDLEKARAWVIFQRE